MRRTVIFIVAASCFASLIPAILQVGPPIVQRPAFAQEPRPTAGSDFDQAAAVARLRERIKGRENEPADKVFKNIQTPFMRSINAGRLLPVMEMAYSRSLGVTCTHCHVPEKWEVDDKPQKQVTREMAAMVARINGELKAIKDLRSAQPAINCTTCHRGELKPAQNIAPREPQINR